MSKRPSSCLKAWNELMIRSLQRLERAGCDPRVVRKLRHQFYELRADVLQYHRELLRNQKGRGFRVRGLGSPEFNGRSFPVDMIEREVAFLERLCSMLSVHRLDKLNGKVYWYVMVLRTISV